MADVLDEELAQFGVVDDPAGVGEFVPCVGPVCGPVFADCFEALARRLINVLGIPG